MRRQGNIEKGGSAGRRQGFDIPPFATITVAELQQARAARPERRRRRDEEALQMACHQWLALREPSAPPLRFCLHVPNGGWRHPAEAARFKALGVKRGVPDFLCPIPWRGWSGFAVELKAHGGRSTPSQKAWQQGLAAAGYLVGEVRCLDRFIAIVEGYLAGKVVV